MAIVLRAQTLLVRQYKEALSDFVLVTKSKVYVSRCMLNSSVHLATPRNHLSMRLHCLSRARYGDVSMRIVLSLIFLKCDGVTNIMEIHSFSLSCVVFLREKTFANGGK